MLGGKPYVFRVPQFNSEVKFMVNLRTFSKFNVLAHFGLLLANI